MEITNSQKTANNQKLITLKTDLWTVNASLSTLRRKFLEDRKTLNQEKYQITRKIELFSARTLYNP